MFGKLPHLVKELVQEKFRLVREKNPGMNYSLPRCHLPNKKIMLSEELCDDSEEKIFK